MLVCQRYAMNIHLLQHLWQRQWPGVWQTTNAKITEVLISKWWFLMTIHKTTKNNSSTRVNYSSVLNFYELSYGWKTHPDRSQFMEFMEWILPNSSIGSGIFGGNISHKKKHGMSHSIYWIFGRKWKDICGKTYIPTRNHGFSSKASLRTSHPLEVRVPSHCLGRTRSWNRNWPAKIHQAPCGFGLAKFSWWIKLWVITVIHPLWE